MKKQACLSTIFGIFAIVLMSNTAIAQTDISQKTVKIYLKSNSWLPKGVGIKEIKPNQTITNSYIGSWMPFSSRVWEVPVGTRLEYISDKTAIMAGNAALAKGKLIVEVRATDEGKTFTF